MSKRIIEVINQFQFLFIQVNIPLNILFDKKGKRLIFIITTNFNPYYISMLTQGFNYGSYKWKINLTYPDNNLTFTAELFYKDFEDTKEIARELQYKRGVIKSQFETYFKKTLPTYK